MLLHSHNGTRIVKMYKNTPKQVENIIFSLVSVYILCQPWRALGHGNFLLHILLAQNIVPWLKRVTFLSKKHCMSYIRKKQKKRTHKKTLFKKIKIKTMLKTCILGCITCISRPPPNAAPPYTELYIKSRYSGRTLVPDDFPFLAFTVSRLHAKYPALQLRSSVLAVTRILQHGNLE